MYVFDPSYPVLVCRAPAPVADPHARPPRDALQRPLRPRMGRDHRRMRQRLQGDAAAPPICIDTVHNGRSMWIICVHPEPKIVSSIQSCTIPCTPRHRLPQRIGLSGRRIQRNFELAKRSFSFLNPPTNASPHNRPFGRLWGGALAQWWRGGGYLYLHFVFLIFSSIGHKTKDIRVLRNCSAVSRHIVFLAMTPA